MGNRTRGFRAGGERKEHSFPAVKLTLIIGFGVILLIMGLSAFGITLLQPFIGILLGAVLLAAAVGLPYMLFRRNFRGGRVKDLCPHCGAWIRVRGYLAQTNCPRCLGLIEVRDGILYKAERPAGE